jgi:predicted Zn-dependent protease
MRLSFTLAILISLAGCGGTGLGLDLVPEQQAEAMGIEAWQAIRTETPVSTNAEYRQRAEKVSARLLQAAGKNPSEWEVVVFGSNEVNAFALPGRKIGIHEGMMRMARTDDQLAAVIGHEIAHVDARHPSERISSQMATQAGVDVAGSLLGASLGTDPRMIAGLLGAGAQFGVLLPYSRNQELEADSLGLRMMAKAGYDPREAVALWEGMKSVGDRAPAFLSTHPAPDARIKQLQAQMPEALKAYQGRG